MPSLSNIFPSWLGGGTNTSTGTDTSTGPQTAAPPQSFLQQLGAQFAAGGGPQGQVGGSGPQGMVPFGTPSTPPGYTNYGSISDWTKKPQQPAAVPDMKGPNSNGALFPAYQDDSNNTTSGGTPGDSDGSGGLADLFLKYFGGGMG
jgi:hypothetical protein